MRWTELFTKTQRDTDLRQSNSFLRHCERIPFAAWKISRKLFSLPRVALRGNGLSSPELRHFAANCIWWSNREHSIKRKVGRAWQIRKHADFVFSTKRITKHRAQINTILKILVGILPPRGYTEDSGDVVPIKMLAEKTNRSRKKRECIQACLAVKRQDGALFGSKERCEEGFPV